MTVRTRFAPSPTGFMHVGGVRTALFSWAFAKSQKGSFILRIEDTDKKREMEGATEHIMQSLNWLGLNWDEGPDGGKNGPYLQSERIEIYHKYAHQLIEAGLAYADPYQPEELERFRTEAKRNKQPFLYRNHRPERPPEWKGTQPLRFKIPEPKRYHWQDAVRGELSAGEEALDDFVIIKSDGFPTYNFAHVIDDHEMEITHVMRGEEFLASTPNFLALHDALGWEYPVFVTLPPVLNNQGGKKLSKRDGAQDVMYYKEAGYLPEALVNFLVTLGWNDGTEQEIFLLDEIVKKFTLDRIQKSGARFDIEKLSWINWQHIKRFVENNKFDTLKTRVPIFKEEAWVQNADSEYLKSASLLAASKANSVDSFMAQLQIFGNPPAESLSAETLQSIDSELDTQEATRELELAIDALQTLNDFSSQNIETALRGVLKDYDLQPRIFLNLVRWAVSGQKISPSLFDMLAVFGKEKSISRLQAAKPAQTGT